MKENRFRRLQIKCNYQRRWCSRAGSGYAQVNAYSGGSRGPMGGYENLPFSCSCIYDGIQ
ncbi:MAG: hypothetical protein R2769_14695 [Saprospiraceae bacterium]